MAAIGKIRSWGPTLAIIVGLALFAFIAEEFFRSCQATSNQQRQQVGEVLGEKISVQDFQALIDEYQEVIKVTQQRDNLSEVELNRIKDMVWQSYVSNQVIADEAERLGLTVTDAEMQRILSEGTNPMLLQTPFVNQQTHRFDVTQLSQFLAEYKKNPSEQYAPIYKYWQFTEKTLRQQLLAQKYQVLLGSCILSNPVIADYEMKDQNTESTVLLASFPYASVSDDEVPVDDNELKALYNEKKEQHRQAVETRDIKYVTYQVVASPADRAAVMATMIAAADSLRAGAAAADIVRKAQSQIAYSGLPVTRAALPSDIAQRVDSLAVGATCDPFETRFDNTLNVVKLISKVQLPDSVEFRAIQVAAATVDEARIKADSIFKAIKGGEPFDSIARRYGQTGRTQWITSADYQNAGLIDADTRKYINALNTTAAGELSNIELTQGNLIVNVTNRKAMVDKYDVAVIKHTIDFSKQTYSEAYNRFSEYVSQLKTIDDLNANAEQYGFQVIDDNDVANTAHFIANFRGTREALKWLFEAKEGQVSPLYECGNNDRLLVFGLSKIHKQGYRDMESLRDELTAEVQRDKKFQKLAEKLASVKTIADAQAQGARVDTVRKVSFNTPFYTPAGASEPILSGAVAATEQGQTTPKVIKGTNGAYLLQVLSRENRENPQTDLKQAEQTARTKMMQCAGSFMSVLTEKAKIVDNRYLFF